MHIRSIQQHVTSLEYEDDILFTGFYIQNAGWNRIDRCISEQQPQMIMEPMPVIQFYVLIYLFQKIEFMKSYCSIIYFFSFLANINRRFSNDKSIRLSDISHIRA